MSSAVTSIIDAINAEITENIGFDNLNIYGNTELVEHDGQTFPRCLASKQGEIVFPDRAVPLKLYHRVGPVSMEEVDEESFGFSADDKTLTADISLFGIGDQVALSKDVPDINQALGAMVMDCFPGGIFAAADNLTQVRISGATTLNEDKLAVLAAEFSGTDLANVIQKLIAFKIDYTIEGRICSGLCV